MTMSNPSYLFFILFLIIIGNATIVFAESQYADYFAYDENGNIVNLTNYEESILFVNVWATWCVECREEMPYINELYQKYSQQGVRFINISIDENPNDAIKMAQRLDMQTELWFDPDNNATREFKMFGPPVSLLIGKDGNLIHEWKGAIIEGTDVEKRIDIALGITSDSETNSEINSQDTLKNMGLVIAFSAGLLSFLSPCILPLIPAYVSFITGMSLKELSAKNNNENSLGKTQSKFKVKTTVLSRGSMFVLGFSIVFITLGIAVSYASSFFVDATTWIERIGGIIIILFGLHLLGILNIKKLNKQKSFDFSKRSTKNIGSILVGMAFGAGWTPCIGPILAGILTIAATSSTVMEGALLLGVYSTGLAIPFVLSAIAIDQFLIFFQKIKKWIGWIERTSGVMLIGIGVLLLTGSLTVINTLFDGSIFSDLQNNSILD